MLHEAEAHHISVILTKSISRFGRDTVDTREALRRLKAAGVRVIFDEEGLDTDEVDDELLISVAESFAQAENESRSMNIRMGLRNHALNGSSGNSRKRLYGYVKDEGGNLVIEPTQAQVVRDIYRWYIDGASILEIQKSSQSIVFHPLPEKNNGARGPLIRRYVRQCRFHSCRNPDEKGW